MGGKRNIQKKPVVTCRRSLTVPGLQEEYRLVYACLPSTAPPLCSTRRDTREAVRVSAYLRHRELELVDVLADALQAYPSETVT